MLKRAIVTGAARGIGREIVNLLAASGWEVYAIDILPEVRDGWKSAKVFPDILDLSSKEQIESYVSDLKEKNLAFCGLVNNAGMIDMGPSIEANPDRLEKVIQVNLMAAVRLTQGVLPLLEKENGRVIHIGSEVVRATGAFNLYGISKHALQAYAEVCRQELALLGMRSILIRPGATNTALLPATHAYSEGKRFESDLAKFNEVAKGGMKNPVSPSEVAKVAVKALESKDPKMVYDVGANPALYLFKMFPRKMVDFINRKMLRG